LHNLIVEDRVVEGKPKFNRVSACEGFLSNFMCISICRECFLSSGITFISDGILSDISVIISLHLEKEDLSFL